MFLYNQDAKHFTNDRRLLSVGSNAKIVFEIFLEYLNTVEVAVSAISASKDVVRVVKREGEFIWEDLMWSTGSSNLNETMGKVSHDDNYS